MQLSLADTASANRALGEFDDGVGVEERLLDLGLREVAAVGADGWQDLLEDPRLEALCVGELAVGDEPVHVRLGDELCLLGAPQAVGDGVVFRHPTAMLLDCVRWVGVT